MKCMQCNCDTSLWFVCPECTKNTGETIKFYVCNKSCQAKVWTTHKQNGHKHFPGSFANVGCMADNLYSEFERAWSQIQFCRTLMSQAQTLDFENADLRADEKWMTDNWDSFKKGMVFHALASFRTFGWKSFLQWLQRTAIHDGSAKEALQLFKNHPAFVEKEHLSCE